MDKLLKNVIEVDTMAIFKDIFTSTWRELLIGIRAKHRPMALGQVVILVGMDNSLFLCCIFLYSKIDTTYLFLKVRFQQDNSSLV